MCEEEHLKKIVLIEKNSLIQLKSISFVCNFSCKMEPLHSIKRILIWLCLCTADKSSSILLKRTYSIFALIIFILNLCGLVAHVVYVYEFLLIDLDGSMFAFLGILGFAGTTFVMIIIFFLRRKMKSLFYKFSEIYDDSKC